LSGYGVFGTGVACREPGLVDAFFLLSVHCPYAREGKGTHMAASIAKKDQRVEFRTSSENRELFGRAAEASGTDLSGFANEQLRVAALRVLADRTAFVLSPVEAALWDELMERPARDLPDVRALLAEPSIFVDE